MLTTVAVILVSALGAGAFYLYRIDRSLTQNLQREDILPAGSGAPAENGTLDFVLIGSDTRDPDAETSGGSDSLMLLHLNGKRDQAYIISFPRDMWVSIPGHSENKINSALTFGGPKLTVATVETLTGARIDHAVRIDFDGFVQLTEGLGGVTVPNKTAFATHGFNYPKGDISISGEKALWFVRERKLLPQGDFDRAENQRNVVKAIVAKGLSVDVITDPGRFANFIAGVAQHLTVDAGLTDGVIRSTALSLRLTSEDIQLMQAPISGTATQAGQSIDVVDQAKMAELKTALAEDTVGDYLKKYPDG